MRSCISARGCGRTSPWPISRRHWPTSPAASGASAGFWRRAAPPRPERLVSDTLRKRVLTAVVLGAALLAILLWLPDWATVAVMTLMVLFGAWEWSAFLLLVAPGPRLAYVALVGMLLWLVWRFSNTPERRDLILALAVLWWLAALAWIVFAPRRVSPWTA